MMYLAIAISVLIVLLWIAGFLYVNDFSVPQKKGTDIKSVSKALVIFPHADDESIGAGGYISKLASTGVDVSWIVLTKGEKGNVGEKLDRKLGEIRVKEAEEAAKLYGVRNLIQKDYPDGDLVKHLEEMTRFLGDVLKDLEPDLVITYDLAGLYGYHDHVITSEVVTELVKNQAPQSKLWYMSFPKKIIDIVSLPEHMATNPSFKDKRVYPTLRVWGGIDGVIKKSKAVYAYQSQRESFKSSFPVRVIPLWFYISLTPFEYFHEVN